MPQRQGGGRFVCKFSVMRLSHRIAARQSWAAVSDVMQRETLFSGTFSLQSALGRLRTVALTHHK